MPREIEGRDHDNERPDFRPAGYYPFDVEFYYTIDQQRETIADLVGSDDLAGEYVIDYDSDIYMARGHLSPNADFVYYSFQVLFMFTFFFSGKMAKLSTCHISGWFCLVYLLGSSTIRT